MSELPSWVPSEAWAGYVEMRKKSRHPLSDRAKDLAIALLASLKDQGNDPGAVLDQSTMNGWRGLFPLADRRADDRRAQQGRASFPSLGKHGQATANNLQDWLEDFQ